MKKKKARLPAVFRKARSVWKSINLSFDQFQRVDIVDSDNVNALRKSGNVDCHFVLSVSGHVERFSAACCVVDCNAFDRAACRHGSNVGCRVYEDRIPIDYQTFKMAEELNMNATVCALSGGEDYELLFTAPLAQYDLLTSLPNIKVIGHTTPDSEGCRLTTRDGNSFELKAQGWTNFSTDNHKNDSHEQ